MALLALPRITSALARRAFTILHPCCTVHLNRGIIDGTTITFKGETYESSREWYESGMPYTMPQTKAYAARLYGLFLSTEKQLLNRGNDDFVLYFGEIDGEDDMDEDLVITWPDKTKDTIHYHCSKHNERKMSCDRSWKLNGKANDSAIFVITK